MPQSQKCPSQGKPRHPCLEVTITTINVVVARNIYTSETGNGRRFAGKLLPVFVIALKRNGAYADDI
jgi:hypothetical protein